MTTNTSTKLSTQVDRSYEVSKFALGVGVVMAALVGVWGTLALISTLLMDGPVTMAKGLLTAITGV